jgi:hypothetical protein
MISSRRLSSSASLDSAVRKIKEHYPHWLSLRNSACESAKSIRIFSTETEQPSLLAGAGRRDCVALGRRGVYEIT